MATGPDAGRWYVYRVVCNAVSDSRCLSSVTLEDALGPASGRFFGEGYRRVRHTLTDHRWTADVFEGVASVAYPNDWSVDGAGTGRVPHLSTIDAVVLPLMALETRAVAALGNDDDAQPHLFVSRLTMRAGARPWSDMEAIPVHLSPDKATSPAFSYAASVGNIKVGISLSFLPRAVLLDNTLGGNGTGHSVYGELYRDVHCHSTLTNLHNEADELWASHAFRFSNVEDKEQVTGIEAAYWPAVTAVDYIVTMGQLTQALIARKRGLLRAQGELWMRSIDLTLARPPLRIPSEIKTRTKTMQERLVERSGRKIRSLVIHSHSSSGVSVEARLAYVETE